MRSAFKLTIYLLAIIGLLRPANSAEDIYISCFIQSSYDFSTGETSQTTGSDVFILKRKKTVDSLDLPFPCQIKTSIIVNETEIFVACKFLIGKKYYERSASINRVTGEYVSIFAPEGKNGLLHSGFCTRKKPLF